MCKSGLFVNRNLQDYLLPTSESSCQLISASSQRQSLLNLAAVLEGAGSSIDNCVKVNIFLTDMADFAAINEVYDKVFHKEPKPCRTCVAVHQLPLGTDVEIECTAHQ